MLGGAYDDRSEEMIPFFNWIRYDSDRQDLIDLFSFWLAGQCNGRDSLRPHAPESRGGNDSEEQRERKKERSQAREKRER
jgi:hypothetical protein